MQVKHTKCSQRVGSATRLYDTAAYRQVYENGTGLTDTSISRRLPWYSYAQQDWIKADKASEFTGATYNQSTDTLREQRELGMKQYEMSDHLGNVLATVLDRKTGYGSSGGNYTGFSADVASITDYYPFGFPMSERSITAENANPFRFGFNGQEKVNEWADVGNHNTAEFWEYDTRTGRRGNLDPVPTDGVSPYSTNLNNPIQFNDPNGDCPWCGAAIGALIDIGFQSASILMSDDQDWSKFSWTSVGISALAGATGVGLGEVVETGVARLGLAGATKIATSIASDIAVDVTVGTAENTAKAVMVEGKDLNLNTIEEAATDATKGAIVGQVAKQTVGRVLKSSESKTQEARSLEKKANRMEGKAKNKPSAAKTARAEAARDAFNKHLNKKTFSRTTAASAAAGKIPDFYKKPCFVAGTLVATNKGYIAIENIQDGDSVLTYSIINKCLEYMAIKDKHHSVTDSVVTLILANGEKIETTPIHSFYVNEGKWVHAGQLTITDIVWFADGRKGAIQFINTIARREIVYNFEVPITHNYFVSKGKILVHNSEEQQCK